MCCNEGTDEFSSQCRGLILFKDNKTVVIDDDSCYGGHRIIYRTRRVFPDGTFLDYDEVLLCADKKLLRNIVTAIMEKWKNDAPKD